MYELVHTLKQKFTTSKKHINGNRHIRHTHIAPKYSWYQLYMRFMIAQTTFHNPAV